MEEISISGAADSKNKKKESAYIARDTNPLFPGKVSRNGDDEEVFSGSSAICLGPACFSFIEWNILTVSSNLWTWQVFSTIRADPQHAVEGRSILAENLRTHDERHRL